MDADRGARIRQPPSPRQTGLRDWSGLTWCTLDHAMTDRVSLAAAGCAFYGTLALFPAIRMLLSVYGLIFDPVSVEPQLHLLAEFLLGPAFVLLEDRVHELISQLPTRLSVSLVASLLLTFWSAAMGVNRCCRP